jgi:1,2-diacylglycerol 3-alpha-glucosyltransferase
MNILMMTNTYKPILGGLEKSVEAFSHEFRRLGHRTIIVAPEYEGMPPEEDVIRIPAVQKVRGSDFSVHLPIPGILTEALGDFIPTIVHSHHPFLIGDTALRLASKYNVPLVFTHHTLYEQNVHYIPGNEKALQQFVIELSTGYANLADQVIAPSESVQQLMKERGVETNIAVVPTGIVIKDFGRGAARSFRKKHHIPLNAFVVGHLGRLALEKNLKFLTDAVFPFLKSNKDVYFLVVGQGPYEQTIKENAAAFGVSSKVRLVGVQEGKDKVDAYHAMDVFVFSSQSETQGLVLTEALAARVPIVAIDAPGVREVVKDKIDGRLLPKEDVKEFMKALSWVKNLSFSQLQEIKKACHKTAENFSMDHSVAKILEIYTSLSVRHGFIRRGSEESAWSKTARLIHAEGGLVKNLTKAATALVSAHLTPS